MKSEIDYDEEKSLRRNEIVRSLPSLNREASGLKLRRKKVEFFILFCFGKICILFKKNFIGEHSCGKCRS
jgi:hypothetical protein